MSDESIDRVEWLLWHLFTLAMGVLAGLSSAGNPNVSGLLGVFAVVYILAFIAVHLVSIRAPVDGVSADE